MVKKNKEILKQAGVMSFMYLILCLGGAYESYYRGADLKLTARIAGCVLLLMWGGIFIFIIKNVDYQDYWHNRGWRRLNVWTTRDNVGNPDFIGDKPIFRKKKFEVVTLILRKFKTTTSHVEVQKRNCGNVEFKPFIRKWNEIMIE